MSSDDGLSFDYQEVKTKRPSKLSKLFGRGNSLPSEQSLSGINSSALLSANNNEGSIASMVSPSTQRRGLFKKQHSHVKVEKKRSLSTVKFDLHSPGFDLGNQDITKSLDQKHWPNQNVAEAAFVSKNLLRHIGIYIVTLLSISLLFGGIFCFIMDHQEQEQSFPSLYLQHFTFVFSLLLTASGTLTGTSLTSLNLISFLTSLILIAVGQALIFTFAAILFEKLSIRPSPIVFSKWAVVHHSTTLTGKPAFQFRIANLFGAERPILQAKVQVNISFRPREAGSETTTQRRFLKLPLVNSEQTGFRFIWTICHGIDAESPLIKQNWESLKAMGTLVTVVVSGIDSKTMKPVVASHDYLMSHILFDAYLEDVVSKQNGKNVVDFKHFHIAHAASPVNRNSSVIQ